MASPLRVDLGCGDAKRPGFVGLDFVDGPEVDHVLDLTKDRYPFEDGTIDEFFSAHFLEHIDKPDFVFGEIGRACRDGAKIEFWTPYAFSDGAFVYGHLVYLTEEPWMQFCVHHREEFLGMLGGYWLLHDIIFHVPAQTAAELEQYGVPVPFAVKYLKGVVYEFGVEIEFRRGPDVPVVMPRRWWTTERDGARQPLDGPVEPLFPVPTVVPDVAPTVSPDAGPPDPSSTATLLRLATHQLLRDLSVRLRRSH